MSELNLDEIRTMFRAGSRSGKKLITLCDEHERLEAAIRGDQGEPRAILTTNVLRWPAEERIAFARHLLGSEWKSPDHERLEGLLRAWKLAADALDTATLRVGFDDPNFMTTVSGYQDEVDATRRAVYAESVRLAKEKM